MRLLQALRDGDTDEAREACNDLCEWLEKGGFMPAEIDTAIRACGGYVPDDDD
jgi:hypothetical protein